MSVGRITGLKDQKSELKGKMKLHRRESYVSENSMAVTAAWWKELGVMFFVPQGINFYNLFCVRSLTESSEEL